MLKLELQSENSKLGKIIYSRKVSKIRVITDSQFYN